MTRSRASAASTGKMTCCTPVRAISHPGPMVRFMVRHLAMISCDPITPRSPDDKISSPKLLIASCPPTIAGGFSPSADGRPPSESGILLCANRIFSKSHLEDTLSHEMIHWWDHCRFKVDWANLRHHACSEIRAASLSGDCRWTREVNRRHFGFLKQHQACTKRRAILSVRANPACKDNAMAERVVDEVWESCFYDTRPFDEVCDATHCRSIKMLTSGPPSAWCRHKCACPET